MLLRTALTTAIVMYTGRVYPFPRIRAVPHVFTRVTHD